jgi:hypothetical protein
MDAATARSLDRAAEIVSRHARDQARARTLGLRLSHVAAATEPGYQHYTPSLSTVLAGRKRTLIGDDDQVWGRERFIITPVGLPLVSSVVATDPHRGFLAARWQLDPAVVAEVAAATPRNARPAGPIGRLGVWSPALADAFARLLALLDEPEHIALLGPLISREIVLRLLQTDQAPRALAALDDGDPVVPRAVSLLTDRMAEPWSMRTIAAEIRTSRPTLYRRFKDATSMTPMQYLKRLRLGEARHRMVVLGESAARGSPWRLNRNRNGPGATPTRWAGPPRPAGRRWRGSRCSASRSERGRPCCWTRPVTRTPPGGPPRRGANRRRRSRHSRRGAPWHWPKRLWSVLPRRGRTVCRCRRRGSLPRWGRWPPGGKGAGPPPRAGDTFHSRTRRGGREWGLKRST